MKDIKHYDPSVSEKEETPKELFTGGEWINSPIMNFSDTLISYINSSTGKPVAQLRGCTNGEEKEAEANAHLLAQAKNMYYELKEILKWVRVKDGKAEWKTSEEKIEELKQLLKKANPSL